MAKLLCTFVNPVRPCTGQNFYIFLKGELHIIVLSATYCFDIFYSSQLTNWPLIVKNKSEKLFETSTKRYKNFGHVKNCLNLKYNLPNLIFAIILSWLRTNVLQFCHNEGAGTLTVSSFQWITCTLHHQWPSLVCQIFTILQVSKFLSGKLLLSVSKSLGCWVPKQVMQDQELTGCKIGIWFWKVTFLLPQYYLLLLLLFGQVLVLFLCHLNSTCCCCCCCKYVANLTKMYYEF